MTTAVQVGETARDRADFCRCFKTGAAVFLHDDGIVAHRVVLAPLLVSSLRRFCKPGRAYPQDAITLLHARRDATRGLPSRNRLRPRDGHMEALRAEAVSLAKAAYLGCCRPGLLAHFSRFSITRSWLGRFGCL